MPTSQQANIPGATRPKGDVILTANTDDFIIGDRVWVDGTKPGYIQYLGETRFGVGEWAGVVLDEPTGKNDGSFAGVHYFQCEPRKGIFARLHKLTRYPLSTSSSPPQGDAPSPLPHSATPPRAPSPGGRFRLGDRVVVNASGGSKAGVLRHLGKADFAAGEWAGVELDEPTGKNDGTVAGKKYFECGPKFGLFAPAHKVSRAPAHQHRGRHHHSSHESLGSSLSSGGGAGRVEKMKDVEQLLKERDLEREDVVRAAAQLDQVEHQLTLLQQEHRRYVEESERRASRLRQLLDAAEAERRNLATRLDEETRKVEDLQFRVDEECIGKDDSEAKREEEQRRIRELESRLEEEIRRSKKSGTGGTQELRREEERVLQMRSSLDNKTRELHGLQDRIAEMEKEMENQKARQDRYLETIDDLNARLRHSESSCGDIKEELGATRKALQESERGRREAEADIRAAVEDPEVDRKLRLKDREVEELSRRLESTETRLAELRERKDAEMEALSERHRQEVRTLEQESEKLGREAAGRRSEVTQEVERLKDEMSRRVEALSELSGLRDQLSKLQAERDLLRVEKEEAVKRWQVAEECRKRAEEEGSKMKREQEEEGGHHVNILQAEVERLRNEFSLHRQDLVRKLAETEHDTAAVQDLHEQIESQRQILESMRQNLSSTEQERDQLKQKVGDGDQRASHLETKASSLQQELEEVKRRAEESVKERESLQRSLEAARILIDQRQGHIEDTRREMESARTEMTQRLEAEQRKWKAATQRETDSEHQRLKRDKEALENHVDFLNSVIVDMQKKTDDLKGRLEILETEVIFDGQVNLGNTMSGRSRLFCGACNAFDLHDAGDCPGPAHESEMF